MLHDFSLQFVTKSVTSSSAGAPYCGCRTSQRKRVCSSTSIRLLDCRFRGRLDTLPAQIAKFLPHHKMLKLWDYFNIRRNIMLLQSDNICAQNVAETEYKREYEYRGQTGWSSKFWLKEAVFKYKSEKNSIEKSYAAQNFVRLKTFIMIFKWPNCYRRASETTWGAVGFSLPQQ